MKILVAVAITFCSSLTLGWFIWGRHNISSTNPITVARAPVSTLVAPPRPQFVPPSNLPLPNEWQELRSVRDTTLLNNPELGEQWKSLQAEIGQQQEELDAAMIKADPKVAPILAKLKELRKRNSTNRSTTSSN